jgi:hypothetical protein
MRCFFFGGKTKYNLSGRASWGSRPGPPKQEGDQEGPPKQAATVWATTRMVVAQTVAEVDPALLFAPGVVGPFSRILVIILTTHVEDDYQDPADG